MSASGSSSSTRTKTFPRLDLVIMQFRRMLRRCGVNTTDEYIEKVCDALRQGWIESILIYGMDANNKCHVEVSLKVDWNEYNRQMSQGAVSVSIDETMWHDDMAVEIEEMIKVFNEAKSLKSLEVQWRISLTKNVNGDRSLKERAYRDLGLVDSPEVKWASGTPVSDRMTIQELSELIAHIRFSQ